MYLHGMAETPEKICRMDWRHEGKTGVWLYVDPRPDEDRILDMCRKVADAIKDADTQAALEAAIDQVRAELGYEYAFVNGFDEPLDLAVHVGIR